MPSHSHRLCGVLAANFQALAMPIMSGCCQPCRQKDVNHGELISISIGSASRYLHLLCQSRAQLLECEAQSVWSKGL